MNREDVWIKPFTIQEDAIIRFCARIGWSYLDVARELGRTRASVGSRARRLGVKFKARCGGAAPNWNRPEGEPHSRDWRRPHSQYKGNVAYSYNKPRKMVAL